MHQESSIALLAPNEEDDSANPGLVDRQPGESFLTESNFTTDGRSSLSNLFFAWLLPLLKSGHRQEFGMIRLQLSRHFKTLLV